MNVFLWIVDGQLSLVFPAAGAMKLLRTKESLAENGMGWTVDFSIPLDPAGAVRRRTIPRPPTPDAGRAG
jgi:hypothetical protein